MQPKASIAVLVLLLLHVTLAQPETSARPTPESLARPCLACHTPTDRKTIPLLFAKPERDFTKAMRQFRDDQRSASVMNRIARGYRDEDFGNMAKYFRNRDRSPR